MYLEKICELHPEYLGRYKNWTEDSQKTVKFLPEIFNQRFNNYRQVFFMLVYIN